MTDQEQNAARTGAERLAKLGLAEREVDEEGRIAFELKDEGLIVLADLLNALHLVTGETITVDPSEEEKLGGLHRMTWDMLMEMHRVWGGDEDEDEEDVS